MNRREFVGALGAASLPRKPLRLGLIVWLQKDPDALVRRVRDLGFPTCQVGFGAVDLSLAAPLRAALERYGIEATSIVSTGPGREVYDFYEGPATIGLVPRATREARLKRLAETSDFAKRCGVAAVQAHCGFIPENPADPLYKETVDAIRTAAAYAKKNGQSFRCETGQETPITLRRAIEDVGLDNAGVNYDPANLILYGKADPVEGLDVVGRYTLGVHAKDGLYPVDPRKLGREVPIGQGKVNFPRFIEKLKQIGYRGPLTIEREISGERQIEDVRAAKAYLERLL
jgi:L-ribulose-5-phosphate 3-epimerase